jgi:hypothetical protein
MKSSQTNHTNTNLKGTLTGLPKLIFDPSKQRSNILEVERALNYFVQLNYPSLSDCIATRELEELQIPVEPVSTPPSNPAELLHSRPGTRSATAALNSSSSSSSGDSESSPPAAPRQPHIVSNFDIARYNEDYRMYLVERQTRKSELSQLFGNIDELLSTTSKEKVIAHDDYASTKKSRNGSSLWNIVYATHQIVNMFHTLLNKRSAHSGTISIFTNQPRCPWKLISRSSKTT